MKPGEISVLALDLATIMGWAAWRPGMNRPAFGAVRLPGKVRDIGEPCEFLRKFLNEKRRIYGTTHAFFEAQHVGSFAKKGADGEVKRSGMSMDTVYKLVGLGAYVEWWGYVCGVHVYKVYISQWRKFFIGRGSGWTVRDAKTKEIIERIDPKELAIQRCERLGWMTNEPDAAEALGILDYSVSLIEGIVPPWRDADLFKAR